MLRIITGVVTAMALLVPSVARAEAWQGKIRCAAIPGVAAQPLFGDFSLTVEGSTLSYDRPVHVADSAAPSGIAESGGGTLSGADITLQGGARGRGYDYAATYRGKLDGNRIHLTGEQVWHAAALHEPFHRPCAIDLTR